MRVLKYLYPTCAFLVLILLSGDVSYAQTLDSLYRVWKNESAPSFDRIIDKYNIEKIKTIGDAYMAAGGLPVPSDSSVKNTVLAALEMQ